jgi:NADH-quinone oxidoreductase subunit K
MPINYYIILAVALFSIGVAGVLNTPQCHHHLYVRGIDAECGEPAAGGIFSKMHAAKMQWQQTPAAIVGTEAQLFVFFIMVVAAAEVSVGLAIIVMMYRNIHSVDVNFLNRLKH